MGNFARRGGALAFLAACVMLFVSCGGGGGHHGGGGGGGADLNSAPGEAALAAWLQASQSYNVMDSTGTYSLAASFTPNAGTTTFNGQANASSRVVTITITENGNPFYSTTYTDYYLLNPNWTPLGAVWSPNGIPYLLVISGSFQEIPATINVGDAGAVFDATYYHNSSQGASEASLSVTYAVTAHNANNLNFCLTYTVSNVTASGAADGIVPGYQMYCFHVDGSGNANLNSWTLYDANTGQTLTF